MTKLILASSSIYRRQLLDKLQLSYTTESPNIDETAKPEETPQALAERLALEKAQAIAKEHADALIIGSDQVASVEDHILGKPGNREKAIQQLSLCAGKTVTFWTGLALHNSNTGITQHSCIPFKVHFRSLSQTQIAAYVEKEQPYDCAGSFKCEGLGIALFESLEGTDPNTLIGLPLIELINMLTNEGIEVLS